MERITLLFDTSPIRAEDILPHLPPEAADAAKEVNSPASLSEKERDHILRILVQCRWNQSKAARRLGIGRTTLWRKIKAHRIRLPWEDLK